VKLTVPSTLFRLMPVLVPDPASVPVWKTALPPGAKWSLGSSKAPAVCVMLPL